MSRLAQRQHTSGPSPMSMSGSLASNGDARGGRGRGALGLSGVEIRRKTRLGGPLVFLFYSLLLQPFYITSCRLLEGLQPVTWRERAFAARKIEHFSVLLAIPDLWLAFCSAFAVAVSRGNLRKAAQQAVQAGPLLSTPPPPPPSALLRPFPSFALRGSLEREKGTPHPLPSSSRLGLEPSQPF